MGRPFYVWRRMLQSCHCTPDTDIGSMQRPIFNTILEVRVIDMVDHCGQGLFHHIAWQNRPIQIITVGGPGYLGIWEYLLDISGTPSPDQQFSRATILAYDGQVAVVRHYPHLLSPISVNTEMSVFLRTFYAAICMSALCATSGHRGNRSSSVVRSWRGRAADDASR